MRQACQQGPTSRPEYSHRYSLPGFSRRGIAADDRGAGTARAPGARTMHGIASRSPSRRSPGNRATDRVADGSVRRCGPNRSDTIPYRGDPSNQASLFPQGPGRVRVTVDENDGFAVRMHRHRDHPHHDDRRHPTGGPIGRGGRTPAHLRDMQEREAVHEYVDRRDGGPRGPEPRIEGVGDAGAKRRDESGESHRCRSTPARAPGRRRSRNSYAFAGVRPEKHADRTVHRGHSRKSDASRREGSPTVPSGRSLTSQSPPTRISSTGQPLTASESGARRAMVTDACSAVHASTR